MLCTSIAWQVYRSLLRGKYTGQSVLGGTFTKEVEYFVRA